MKTFQKFLAALSVSAFFLTSFSGNLLAADSFPENTQFLRTQNVLETGEEKLPADHLVTRSEWVHWILRSTEFFGDKVINEPFQDVKNDSYISKAWRDKAVKTNADFYPDAAITVEQAFKMVFRLANIALEAHKEKLPWNDLSSDTELKNAVLKAIALGIWKPEQKNRSGAKDTLSFNRAAEVLRQMEDLNLFEAKKKLQSGTEITIKSGFGSKTPDAPLWRKKLDYILDALQNKFVYPDRTSADQLSDAAIKGLVNSVNDQYTEYLPKERTDQLNTNLSGELVGIGAALDLNATKEVVILTVFPGTPAEKGKLHSGDVILKVDDMDMTGKSTGEVASYIKGEKGTSVKIIIRRGTEQKEFTLVRDKIKIEQVKGILNDNILQITVFSFGPNTAADFQKVLDANLSNRSLRGVIVDLRGNPGGEVNAVLAMLGEFLPAESAGFWEKDRQDDILKQEVISDGTPNLTIPLVVLVDGNSASASEIFAGAIKDYKRGIVVGTKTFGKGTVQQLSTFQDGSSFKFTVAHWLTPNRNEIDGKGILPDVIVPAVDGKDKQLEAAINTIKRGQAQPHLNQK